MRNHVPTIMLVPSAATPLASALTTRARLATTIRDDALAVTLHADRPPPHAGMTVSKARKATPQGDTAMAELPPDVWGTVVLATLAAEGRSFDAWTRLSLASRHGGKA